MSINIKSTKDNKNKLSINETFYGISTIITIIATNIESQASGFFYHELIQENVGPDKGWSAVKTWLVTNRHVILPRIKGKEITPNQLTFRLRKINGTSVEWEPITLDRSQIISRVRLHKNSEVDVALIQVDDLIREKVKTGASYMNSFGVTRRQFAGNNNINVEVGDDALVIGYPLGFYDEVNLYPIVKSGIIASGWGLRFGGEPIFLIDAKLFPGSSGSLVVSRPTNTVVINGQTFTNENKQFAFLGIYSGEPFMQSTPIELEDITIIRKQGYNIGIVWYAYLVEEIIHSGRTLV
jgi:S1-C subfamily serine protease